MREQAKSEGGAAREMVTFRVGRQEFCIDVMQVREIRVWAPATPIVRAPTYVCGVINLRGAILPIIDFAARLGYKPTEPTTRHAILVAQVREQLVGLLVEGVSEILTVAQDLIQPTPEVASRTTKDFVRGVIALDGRMISMIDLDAVIPNRADAQAA